MELTIEKLQLLISQYLEGGGNLKDLVYIERIEDIYFEKYNWKTENLNFGNEDHDIFIASQVAYKEGKFTILGHY